MKIGIPTIWFKRGQSYLSLQIKQALEQAGHEVYIFARTGEVKGYQFLERNNEFHVEESKFSTYPTYEIPAEIFKTWIEENNLNAVFFVEEQYQHKSLVKVAANMGCSTFGVLMTEFLNLKDSEQYQYYDKIICPTQFCYNLLSGVRLNGVKLPIEYVRWGVDIDLFKPDDSVKTHEHVCFFHNAGWGGVYNRKNTQAVIDAFLKMNKHDESKLYVHKQIIGEKEWSKSGNLIIDNSNVEREQVVRMYQCSDVSVLPSRWEGLGIPFMESIACGLPVVTVNFPPMNEWLNMGYLADIEKIMKYDGIHVNSAEVSISSLSNKMDLIVKDKNKLKDYKEISRSYAEKFLNWNENGKVLAQIVEEG